MTTESIDQTAAAGDAHADGSARGAARLRAVQALYCMGEAGVEPGELQQLFLREPFLDDPRDDDLAAEEQGTLPDPALLSEFVTQIPKVMDRLDAALRPCLDRDLARVDPVERAILRLGAYELAHRLDTPYRVVINEAVELCKRVGAESSHRYINGVLDKLAGALRGAELGRRRGAGPGPARGNGP